MKLGGTVNYYDSLSISPPMEIQQYFINRLIIFNYEQDQKIDQVICGHLCLVFVLDEVLR